ncbi:pleckstrin homology domain-containing family G member 7 [Eublepharis macularius]|uniref:Pleckstrin homology domain-containing family G member 7 n=1 Tax=Eublepharis macularius TaxID=481883 RepID=A0AA97L788_EUBMA|nr:pleckstrin homology domain-containing family G member 7 [Eublepharis macularius]
MQKTKNEFSFEMDEDTNMKEQYHIQEGTEPWEDHLGLLGESDLGNVVISSYVAAAQSGTERQLYPSSMQKQRVRTDTHLLEVPLEEPGESDNVSCQFVRHAPGRISTSPTLRRLRKSTLSGAQIFALQNDSNSPRLGKHCESYLPICRSPPPPPFSEHFFFSEPFMHTHSLSQKEISASIDTTPVLPRHEEDDHSGDRSLPNAMAINPAFQSQGEQNSQECVQKLDSHKASLYNSTERRHSSVVVSLPGLEVFPGDLLISDSAAEFLYHSTSLQSAESKKPWWPFAKKGTSTDRHKQVSDLEKCLSSVIIKTSEYSSYEFHNVKDKVWHEIITQYRAEPKANEDQLETKKKQAVWELFITECTYFLDHLLVLKMVFMDTLKYLQSKEFLSDVNSSLLFANLEELNQVSLGFVTSFFSVIKGQLVKPTSSLEFISALTKSFQGNLCQSLQIYCLNYTAAVFYLEKLKKRKDFGIYMKWCEQKKQCKRLHLSELLVAPLHRLTRYPLLLENIWKKADPPERAVLCSVKEKVEKSIRDLEGKVKWLDNFQKFKQLQEMIIWPPLWDQDKRFFVPESLKFILRDNPNESILSPTKRYLLHEGRFTLAEHTRLIDIHLFLFDDLLLVTKPNRHKKKSGCSNVSLISVCSLFTPELQSLLEEGGSCTVLNQPIPLDRLIVKNIDAVHITAVFGLRNAFLIQQENRYQQCIALFLIQAQTESIKKTWMSQMETAISNYARRQTTPQNSFLSLPTESSEI